MEGRLVGIAMQILVMAIVISVVLLFIGIGLLILIHVCILGRGFRRSLGDENNATRGRDSSNASRGLSADELKKLPCYDYEENSAAAECAVCLEMFRAGEKCRMLPECRHSFHAVCVDSWLQKTAICPTCRTSANKGVGKDGTEMTEMEPAVTADSDNVRSNFPLE